MTGRVGMVLVAHSAQLAQGIAELVAQMAPDVAVLPAGGAHGGGLGTSYDAVAAAIASANSGAGVVLLYDLGSAQMTAELAVEALDDPASATVTDAPLVEGAAAAAVAAQGGADMATVAEAAAAASAPENLPEREPDADEQSVQLTLHNQVGLHARPAALLARTVAGLDASVRVRFGEQESDAHSVLGLMSLGARHGDRIEVLASGVRAAEALRRVSELAERDFGEGDGARD